MMKSILSFLILAFSTLTFAKDINLPVDTSKTNVKWTGSKKPVGSHWGTVKIKKGEIKLKDGNLSGGSFVIDMTSIDSKDLDGSDKDAKLEGHLKSPDFFDVTNKKLGGQEATFKITSASLGKGGKYDVTGDLTILKQTKPVSFTAELSKLRNGTYKAWGKIVVDRTKYGIKYKSKSILKDAADNFINDEFVLDVSLVTKK